MLIEERIQYTLVLGLIIKLRSKTMMPWSMTISLIFGPSPAILPRAQIDCSTTSMLGELSNSIKRGTAPALTTSSVCSEVPDTIFVRLQAASNCRAGLSTRGG